MFPIALETRAQRRGDGWALGGNGILLDSYAIRHIADIESTHTFEGTGTIQILIVGRDITGTGAFT